MARHREHSPELVKVVREDKCLSHHLQTTQKRFATDVFQRVYR